MKLTDDCLSIMQFNVRSMPKNIGNLELYLENINCNFKIIGLCETWLNASNFHCYNIEGYNIESSFRTNRTGGGVSILIKRQIQYKLGKELMFSNDCIETIFVEINKTEFSSSKNIVIGSIYRPPNTPIEEFLSNLNAILDQVHTESKIVYILGDFNINLLNVESHVGSSEFLELMYSNTLLPLINRPTRITEKSASIIDNIFCNELQNVQLLNGIFITDLTDHYPTFTLCNRILSKETQSFIYKRKLNQRNIQLFCDHLSLIDWSETLEKQHANECFNSFYNIVKKEYDQCIPKQKVKIGYKNKKPWLTQGLKLSSTKKGCTYHSGKILPSPIHYYINSIKKVES
jgi:hypothetical protein